MARCATFTWVEITKLLTLFLALLCFFAGVRTYRKGHPWTILSLVIFNCGMTGLSLSLGELVFGEHRSYYWSNLLFPLGLFVFFRNIQTPRISRSDCFLLGLSLLELGIALGLCISSYFFPVEAYASSWANQLARLMAYYINGELAPEFAFQQLVFVCVAGFFYLQMVLMPIVLVRSYFFLSRAKRNHLEFFSQDSFGFYLWTQRLVLLTFACFILIGGIIFYNLQVDFSQSGMRFGYLLIVTAGALFGILAYRGPRRLVRVKEFEEFLLSKKDVDETANGSSKSADRIQALQEAMTNGLAYKDPDLTLSKMAEKMGMSSRSLSRFINGSFGQSFSDFVNGYRVEEVKRNLVDPHFQHYTIQGIGQEAGFNSKSTFYSVFKKTTGMTPAQFQVKERIP